MTAFWQMFGRAASHTLMVVWLLVSYITLAPASLGGAVTYVTTSGNSMEPLIHQGDLILLREADSYGVGDVAGFVASDMGRIVLHRIIEDSPKGFVTKGDNNSWKDPYFPRSEHFLGKMWIHIPGAGSVLQLLHQPVVASVVLGGTVLLAILSMVPVSTIRRNRRLRAIRRIRHAA